MCIEMVAWRVFRAIIELANGATASRRRHEPRASRLADVACVVDRSNVRVALSIFRARRGTFLGIFTKTRAVSGRCRCRCHRRRRLTATTARGGSAAARANRRESFRRAAPRRAAPLCSASFRSARPLPPLFSHVDPAPRVSRGECERDRSSPMSSAEIYLAFKSVRRV